MINNMIALFIDSHQYEFSERDQMDHMKHHPRTF